MAVLVASAVSTACGAGEPGDVAAAIGSPSPSPSVSASPSGSAAVRAAEALVALAQGTGSSTVPWAEQVTYYIGDVRVADLTPKELPAALRSCPAGEAEYEQRECPVSPLKTIATMVKDGDVVVEPGAPTTLGCTNVTIPKDTATLAAATVRPLEKDRNCITDFAVTLFTDATGNVDTIQFTLDGP